MHILYHIPYGVIGGAETHIKYLVKFLPPGFRVSISCEHKETMAFAETVAPGQVYFTPSANLLYKVLERQRVDVVQFYHSPTAYLALRKMQRPPKAVEVIHNRHHFNGDSTGYPKNLTSVVVGVSPDAADYFMTMCPGVPTEVIPNGIDTTVFFPGPAARRTGPLVGGFTGRLETDGGKGIMQILDVAKACPEVLFELVGLDYGGHFEKHVKKSNLPNVRIHGHTDNIVDFYRKWDFFISMSPSEGFGYSIAEAITCGVPSIVRRCGGICHYLKDKVHCYLIDSPHEAANILKTVEMRISHGLTMDGVDFSARTMAQRYANLYRGLFDKKKDRPLMEEAAGLVSLPKRGIQRGMEHRGRRILGISPEGWHGIRRAMTTLCDQWCDPKDALATIKSMKPTVVVFGSYRPTLDPVRIAAQMAGAKTVLTWHGTHLFNEFSEGDRRLMAYVIQMAKDRHFDFVATPHEGTAACWTRYGVETDYLPNLLNENIKSVFARPGGHHIGIMGTGFPWKNMESQILGANMVGGTRVWVQAMHADMVLRALGAEFQVAKTGWGNDYLQFMGSMHLNLSIGITETFGYYAAESMLAEVPAIVSPMIAFFRDAPEILQKCVVREIDNPAAIAATIEDVLANRKEIGKEARKFIVAMNQANKAIVDGIKEKWLS